MTILKRKTILFLLIACSSIQLSMTWPTLPDYFGILEPQDYELERERLRPALNSVPGDELQWESFNEWLCFPQKTIEFSCITEDSRKWEDIAPEERDGEGYYPTMNLEHDDNYYTIEFPGRVDSERCFEEIEKWKSLIKDQPGFCVFAAKLPSEDELLGRGEHEEHSVWIMYGIKTMAGEDIAPIYRDSEDEE